MKWWTMNKNKVLNLLSLAAPVVAGVASGGVFTAPVLIAALAAIVGKLAASPLNHDKEKHVPPSPPKEPS